MNGSVQPRVVEHDKYIAKPDLLAHKYRPESVDKFKCHYEQAKKLKQWIQDHSQARNVRDDDLNDNSSSASDASCDAIPEATKKCVLLTGPPGVGKTSLVYTVAKELNMHVVESHSSEKRDFKLFSALKQANQKGKINPIARMFQAVRERQDQQHVINPKRKRRKLDELQQPMNNGSAAQISNQCLSLSGDSSIVLFDDIDVVFEEDGPFLKSLVEFIRDSKRPVVLTATQSIDFIKAILVHFEHIHLGKPMIDECTQLLKDVCRRERLNRLAKVTHCRSIARRMNCDIRQCLNRIHFYGEQAACDIEDDDTDVTSIVPDLTRLNEFLSCGDIIAQDNGSTISNQRECNPLNQSERLLSCYASSSLTDLMDSTFNFIDRQTLLTRWLDGKPSMRNEEHSNNHELGIQIKRSIVELTYELCSENMTGESSMLKQERQNDAVKQAALSMGHTMNKLINSRIEPPEVEFYTDIVPMLGAAIKLEAERRWQHQHQALNGPDGVRSLVSSPVTTGGKMAILRRTRRVQSYLETIGLYPEPEDYTLICETLLTPERLLVEETE